MKGYILKNGYVVTMNSEREILFAGTVVVVGKKILWVGESSEWNAEKFGFTEKDFQEIDCQGKCILPGFIDCGGYAGFGYMHHADKTNLFKTQKKAEAALKDISSDFFRAEGRTITRQRITLGYTTGAVNYPWMKDETREHHMKKIRESLRGQKSLGIRTIVGIGVSEEGVREDDREEFSALMNGEEKQDSTIGWRLYLGNIIGEQGRHGRMKEDISLDDRETAINRIRSAKYTGIPLTADVFGKDLLAFENSGEDIWESAEWLFQYGNDLTYREIMEISRHKIGVSHVVEETIRYCPFAEMLERGIPCAIMNENGFRGGSLDPFQTARRAQMIEQLRFDDLFYLPVGKQLELLTVDAARVLGMEDKIGSLEAGKYADLLVVDLRFPRTTPSYDMPVHRLMMDGNGSQITEVMINGKKLLEKGELLQEKTSEEVEQEMFWAQELQRLMGKVKSENEAAAGLAYGG